jgi:hypothetical protein
MKGLNAAFTANPYNVLLSRPVNNFIDISSSPQMNVIDHAKLGDFDLYQHTPHPQVILRPLSSAEGEPLITAYWCPYVFRPNVGFVDIPEHNPLHHFVFTTLMNGCSLITIRTPGVANSLRVYHHSFPDTDPNYDRNTRMYNGHNVLSFLHSDEYGSPGHRVDGRHSLVSDYPDAFNCLYYDNVCGWVYVSQTLIIHQGDPTRRVALAPQPLVVKHVT